LQKLKPSSIKEVKQTTTEKEIENLLQIVLEGRQKLHFLNDEVEHTKKTMRDVKLMNDERIHKIQEENRQLDSDLGVKQATYEQNRSKIETEINDARWSLLKRIIMCNLKNVTKTVEAPKLPDQFLTRIYPGQFVSIYDEITLGEKPVNMHEWKVRVAVSESGELRDLLRKAWATYGELHWGYGGPGSDATLYQRDFPSQEKAIGYARRNRTKICKDLIHKIKTFEDEVTAANDNIDEVFDFRLFIDPILKPQYARNHNEFQVTSAEKHQMVLTPTLSIYERDIEKLRPYTITVTQEGYQLTISGHRLSSEARNLKYGIIRYFGTEFKAIDKDTEQEIPNPRW
jgi:hypothetical protein